MRALRLRAWQLQLMIWKNMTAIMHQRWLALIELMVPTLMIASLAWQNAEQTGLFTSLEYPNTSYNVYEAGHITRKLKLSMWGGNKQLMYSPITPFTTTLMETVGAQLELKPHEVRGCEDEECVMETYQTSLEPKQPFFLGAIVFDPRSLPSEGAPWQLVYTIRHPLHWKTDLLFDPFRNPEPRSEREVSSYVSYGLLGLQIAVDQTFSIMVCQRCTEVPPIFVMAQAMPQPAGKTIVNFTKTYMNSLSNVMMSSGISIVILLASNYVGEKDGGTVEMLRLYGVPAWLQRASWLLTLLLVMFIPMCVNTWMLTHEFELGSGAVYNYAAPSVILAIFTLHLIASSATCIAISSVFQHIYPALATNIVFWFLSYHLLFMPVKLQRDTMDGWQGILTMLFPNVAFAMAFHEIGCGERNKVMVDWSSVDVELDKMYSLLDIMSMFILDTVLALACAWYISSIRPGKYGVPLPWYFPFKSKRRHRSVWHQSVRDTPSLCENEPEDLEADIEIDNVRKVYASGQVAVENLTLNAYRGQITALVGHNGAGKTTLVRMIASMSGITSGTVTVCGEDVSSRPKLAMSSVGLCPQHEMHFQSLTVLEHLLLYGQLKGMSRNAALYQANSLMKRMGLSEKADSLASTLSGGQKRKLSLGVAFMGHSKVVILDEPTSGMDVQSRHFMWNLLLELRKEFTILLVTHYMEEADAVGDRIAVMKRGRLACCGSPMFLKRRCGSGYSLRVVLSSGNCKENVGAFLNKHAKAEVTKDAGEEVTWALTEHDTSVLPDLLDALSCEQQKLGVETFSVSLTTLDDVFIKIGDETMHNDDEIEDREPSIMIEGKLPLRTGKKLMWQQFKALMAKRHIYAKFHWFQNVLVLFLAALTGLLCVKFSNHVGSLHNAEDPLSMSLESYANPVTLIRVNGSGMHLDQAVSSLLNVITHGRVQSIAPDSSMEDVLFEVARRDLNDYIHNYLAAVEMVMVKGNGTDILLAKAMYSSFALHSAGLALNLVNNAVVQYLAGPQYGIRVTNHPLPNSPFSKLLQVGNTTRFTMIVELFIGIIPGLFSAMGVFAITPPLQERLRTFKHLQLMTGLDPMIYWLSHYVYDVCICIAGSILILAMFATFDTGGSVSQFDALVAMLVLFTSFSLSTIPMSYLLSRLGSEASIPLTAIAAAHVILGQVMPMQAMMYYASKVITSFGAKVLQVCSLLGPNMPLSLGMRHILIVATNNGFCHSLDSDTWNIICNSPVLPFMDKMVRKCCDSKTVNQGYFTWTFGRNEYGLGQALTFIVIDIVTFALAVLALEYLPRRTVKESAMCLNTADPDVQREISRVKSMPVSSCDALTVRGLAKDICGRQVVSGLWFGVPSGECFGLLGVNGAGKTTTFRMLSGDLEPTCGSSHLLGQSVGERKRYLPLLGYCPQNGGLLDELTGMEHLLLLGRLKGMGPVDIGEEAERLTRSLGLSGVSSRPIGACSGGTQRRFSTCLALLGAPPVLLLDEPSSGVDPVSRRLLWRLLSKCRASGQALVMASHGLEEVESMCTRMAIVVRGQIKCLGGPEHLKRKYDHGWNISIKLDLRQDDGDDKHQQLPFLKEQVAKLLGESCRLVDEYLGLLQYRVDSTVVPLATLFRNLENLKRHLSLVSDYSVSATNLEDVFLEFAKEDNGRKSPVSDKAFFPACKEWFWKKKHI